MATNKSFTPDPASITLLINTLADSVNFENAICKAKAPSLVSPKASFNRSNPLATIATIPSLPIVLFKPSTAFL